MSKDIDIRFTIHPLTGDLVIKNLDGSINQSLRSIILTGRGQRRLEPLYGVGINDLLFEQLDMFGTEYYVKRIKQNVFLYEPRIKLINMNMVENPAENSLSINLNYVMVSGGQPQNYNLTLERLK